MVVYAIRHKKTGKLMPQYKKRGYSHWNPDYPDKVIHAIDLGIPRLLPSINSAKKVITAWIVFANGENDSDDFGSNYDVPIKDDGRKKEDLEVVEVELCIK